MRWILRRIGQAVVTYIGVVTLTFVMIRFLPGGPLDFIRARLKAKYGASAGGARIEQLVALYSNIRPDRPIWVQYINYWVDILHFDFGKSMLYGVPVSNIISRALPWTVFVMSIGLLLTVTLGITIGAIFAYNEGTRLDVFGSSISVWFNSVPYYAAALILLYILGYRWGLFPTKGRIDPSIESTLSLQFFMSALYHAALPALSIAITELGGWIVNMRGNSIQILGEDYLRVARLRGLPSNHIALRYVGRNAILPMYTNVMVAIGFVFGGSVILEQIFAYPGIGFYMIRGLNARDYPLVMGTFIVLTFTVVIGVLIADLTYGLVDPRIREGEANA